jgi:FlaA1/EpsC-like NDP-sugar epimerase
MNIHNLIDQKQLLFNQDIGAHEKELSEVISSSRFLVIGGAGTIGQAVTKEIFKRNPKKLHAVDISENNLVELVRDLRSEYGYIDGDFQTFALDIGSPIYDAFIASDGQYDYVLNLSALKHVRSEKDPFTLMRMVEVNILNTIKTIQQSKAAGVKKYFCVSTDKAANPVNMMGASKRIMELFLMRDSKDMAISTARFANVAYSDGSLLHGFKMRIEKNQPIVAPDDVRRYFVSKEESGQLCLMSSLMGENRDIFFPKLDAEKHLVKFSDLAVDFVKSIGYEPFMCDSENEARELAKILPSEGKWPCYFSPSDTTGEKDFEEFFTEGETLDLERFEQLGIVKSQLQFDDELLNRFLENIDTLRSQGLWTKESLVNFFYELLPEFKHLETGKYLDAKM